MNKKTKLFTLAFVAAGIFSTNTFCMDLSTTQYENLETEYYEYGKKWDKDLNKITWKNKTLKKRKKIGAEKPSYNDLPINPIYNDRPINNKSNEVKKKLFFLCTYDYQRIINYATCSYKEDNKEIKHDEHEKKFAKTVNDFLPLQKKFFALKKLKEEKEQKEKEEEEEEEEEENYQLESAICRNRNITKGNDKEKTVKTTNSLFALEFIKSLNPLSVLKSLGSIND